MSLDIQIETSLDNFVIQCKVCEAEFNGKTEYNTHVESISEDLKWDKHIEFICSKAKKRMWMLRRMLQLGLNHDVILDFYFKDIRSILEYGALVFNSGLTGKLSEKVKGIQKMILSLISRHLGLRLTYSTSCIHFSVEPLFLRRIELCQRFIKRNTQVGNTSKLFTENDSLHDTRKRKYKYREYKCQTTRYYNSPLVYLTRMANKTSYS